MKDSIRDVTIYFPARDMILSEEVISLGEGETRLRRKIAAISEGVHNSITFEAEEIQKAVDATIALAEAEGRSEIVPAVIDHCDSIECLIGAANKVSLGKIQTADGKAVPAAIMEVDYDEDTPRQREVAAIIRRHPQLVMNSIRARGKVAEDEEGKLFMKDFIFVHLGHVLDPADRNAKGIEQQACPKAKKDLARDAPFYAPPTDATSMTQTDQARLQELEAKVEELTAKNQSLETELASTKAELETARKEPVIAAILAAKPDFNQDLLRGMSPTQLQALQIELQALAPAPGTRSTGKGAATGGGAPTELTADQQADALFGAL